MKIMHRVVTPFLLFVLSFEKFLIVFDIENLRCVVPCDATTLFGHVGLLPEADRFDDCA